MRSLVGWSQCIAWTRCLGAPASAKARAKCSPHNGERGECFTTTALPASTAGTTTFTAVSSG